MPVKLPILLVSTYPPDRDGIAAYTARLESGLRKERVPIEVAASGKDWKRNNVTYIFSIIKKAIATEASIVHVQLSYFTFGNEYFTGLFPILSMGLKIARKKVVVTFHDLVQKSNINNDLLISHTDNHFLDLKRLALSCFTKVVCLTANRVVVHTEIAKEVLIQDYGVPQERIRVIPHGIDQPNNNIKEDQFRDETFPSQRRRIVTYFGLVKHGKGLEVLVEAWKKIQDGNVELRIIGGKHPTATDEYFKELTFVVKKLGLERSIRFCGYVPETRLPEYFSESEAFVFPYNEWGEVVASSGALSFVAPYLKPIVATDVPAFHDLKDLGAAVIVKKGNADELASAIIGVLTDGQTRDTLKNKLSKWLPESSWSVVARRTRDLYAELL